MPNGCLEIEFVGGPYDGHRQVLSTPLGELAEIVALPVSRDIFRLLHGKTRGPVESITSVAVYQLEVLPTRLRHRFVGAASPMLGDVQPARPPQSEARSGHER
jgi:hypothetical protein